MLEAIGKGILTGLVLATFIGPIFFAVVDLGLNGNLKGAAYIAFGTFISDILTVLFIYFVAKNVHQDSPILQGMYIVGGLILVVLGLQNVLKSKIAESHLDMHHNKPWTFFTKGFLINSMNPNVFFFWFGAVIVAVNTYQNQAPFILLHFFCALLVVFSTDFLKGYLASLLRHHIQGNILLSLSRLSGLILVYFGVKLMFFH